VEDYARKLRGEVKTHNGNRSPTVTPAEELSGD
jgi:hypothetical protein